MARHRVEVAAAVVLIAHALAVWIDQLQQVAHGVVGRAFYVDGRRLSRCVPLQRSDDLSDLAERAVRGLDRAGLVLDLDDPAGTAVTEVGTAILEKDVFLAGVVDLDQPVEVVEGVSGAASGPMIGFLQEHAVAHQVELLLDEPGPRQLRSARSQPSGLSARHLLLRVQLACRIATPTRSAELGSHTSPTSPACSPGTHTGEPRPSMSQSNSPSESTDIATRGASAGLLNGYRVLGLRHIDIVTAKRTSALFLSRL